ncbi:brachyurin-like [Sitophilus oryzae]|uniref:Brachyurin-like n=1 Tax=Sitophilus oryzae TaxID=7048 RepID=A0A6J2YLS3_SITOR|nr:brachyurin-like [Sitophilus oryzae]
MWKTVFLISCLVAAAFCAEELTYEDFKKATPLYLENDPDVQKQFPFLKMEDADTRIVGGEEAVPNSRNYQVGLYIAVGLSLGFCGGSLISTRTVLTAAHCVDGNNAVVTMFFGAHNMPPLASENATQIASSNIILHPLWQRNILLHDIALIILNEPITLSDRIGIVDLPTQLTDSYIGETVLVSGWGRPSDSSNSISPILREVTNEIISNYPCRLAYFGIVSPTHICLSGLNGRGTCNGDSGGPLVVNRTQIGIVSFGSGWGCAHGWPSVFARVTSYINWITANAVW